MQLRSQVADANPKNKVAVTKSEMRNLLDIFLLLLVVVVVRKGSSNKEMIMIV